MIDGSRDWASGDQRREVDIRGNRDPIFFPFRFSWCRGSGAEPCLALPLWAGSFGRLVGAYRDPSTLSPSHGPPSSEPRVGILSVAGKWLR